MDTTTVLESFRSIIYASQELEKRQKDYGTATTITGVEIRAIQRVGLHPGIALTSLAGSMEFSKAACSQLLQRMIRRGLLYKEVDPENLSRYRIFLTESGTKAFLRHGELRRRGERAFLDYLEQFSTDQLEVVEAFLSGALPVITAL